MGILDFLSGKKPEQAPAGAPAEAPKPEAATAAAQAPAPESGEAAGGRYVVKEGDTLWKIAEAHYGAGQGGQYEKIFEANRDVLKDPDVIRPGQSLVIPGVAAGQAAGGATAASAAGWAPPEEISGKKSG